MPRPGIHAQSPLLRRSLAGFMLALAGAAAGPASAAPILEATSYPTLIERAATKLYSGDLDADGFGDLLIPVAEGRLVCYRGLGDFDFAEPMPLPITEIPQLRLADVDADGRLDLLGRMDSRQLRIWFGRGDCTFDEPHDDAAVAGTDAFEIVDFDLDGRPDIVILDRARGWIRQVHPLRGAAWTSEDVLPVAPGTTGLAIGRLDSGSSNDLVLIDAAAARVEAWLAGTQGTWTRSSSPAIGSRARGMELGDVDGDGHTDVVLEHNYDFQRPDQPYPDLGFLFGNGRGEFTPFIWGMLRDPEGISLVDVDADGVPEILNSSGSVIRVDATRTISEHRIPSLSFSSSLVAIDSDADGHVDLASVNGAVLGGVPECRFPTERFFDILPGRGDGGFGTSFVTTLVPSATGFPREGVSGDFDRDGRDDVVTSAGDTLIVMLSRGDRAWEAHPIPASAGLGRTRVLLAVDVDVDGALDLVALSFDNGNILVAHGDGKGSFAESRIERLLPWGVQHGAAIDFEGDGLTEIIAVGSRFPTQRDSVWIFGATPDGWLELRTRFAAGADVRAIGVRSGPGGRGEAMLGFPRENFNIPSEAVLLRVGEDGVIGPTERISLSWQVEALEAADVDQDGDPEWIALQSIESSVLQCGVFSGMVDVFRVTGEGAKVHSEIMSSLQVGEVQGRAGDLATADLNADGHVELAVLGYRGVVRVFKGTSGGFAGGGTMLGARSYAYRILALDVDGDRRIELAPLGADYLETFNNRGAFPSSGEDVRAVFAGKPDWPPHGTLVLQVSDGETIAVAEIDPSTAALAGVPARGWTPVRPGGRPAESCSATRQPEERDRTRDFRFDQAAVTRAAAGATPTLTARTYDGRAVAASPCSQRGVSRPSLEAPEPFLVDGPPRLVPAVVRAGEFPRLQFTVPTAGTRVALDVYDVRGRRLAHWDGGERAEGRQEIWLGDLPGMRSVRGGAVHLVDLRVGSERRTLRWIALSP